jgi:hypothetical protein
MGKVLAQFFEDQTIVVKRGGAAADPKPEATDAHFDLQDALLAAGVIFLEIAAVVIWWPGALILGGAFSFAFVWMIEIDRAKRERTAKPKRVPTVAITDELRQTIERES